MMQCHVVEIYFTQYINSTVVAKSKGFFTYQYLMHNIPVKVQSHYSVWHQRMIIRSHTQIYVSGTLGIRRVRSLYADIRCTSLYAEAKNIF